MSNAWSWFLIALLILNIGGCVWLLWWTARRRPGDPAPTDTSHVWDGDVTEYNKPLPKWWINLFYITIVFAIGYVAWFPGFGNFAGFGNWSSHAEYDREKAAEDAKLAETFKPYNGQPIDKLAANPTAVALGRSIFSNTCATCHGSSASGALGYPNLTDTIWHWGGTPDRVLQTVLDGREGVMPSWSKVLTGMAGDNGVDYVAAYVRTLSHPEEMQNNYMAAQGKPLFESLCVGCHGKDGKGNAQVGAPDLTDDYWLYGDSSEALHKTIADGRHGSMPAHRALLGETRVRLVAAYVWSLSHKPKAGLAESGRAAP
jgi:cytochrome c oxidase cbb3-type subunit 3